MYFYIHKVVRLQKSENKKEKEKTLDYIYLS
jgi:hypothetical protein